MLLLRAARLNSFNSSTRAFDYTFAHSNLPHVAQSRRKQLRHMSNSAAPAPAGPPGPERENSGDRTGPEVLKEVADRAPELLSKAGPIRGVDTSTPTAGLVAKVQELKQRLEDTPGTSTKERVDNWYEQRTSEHAADATGVTWPSAHLTKLWKFFFKAGTGTTDRYGLAIKMGPMDQRTDEERAAARAHASADQANIDAEERMRRVTAGTGLLAICLAVGAVMVQQEAGGLARSALVLPLFLGFAETASGVFGLWSIGFASIWDVDGTGMQQVPDADLDLAIRKRLVKVFGIGSICFTFLMAAWLLAPL